MVSVLNTRSLPAMEYGDVRYVNNIITFFSGILLFGYFISGSRLLALAKDEHEIRELKGLLITILLCTYFILCLVMLAMGFVHSQILHRAYSSLFYITLPVCGSMILLNYINTTSQGDNSIYTIALGRLLPPIAYLLAAYMIYRHFGATPGRMLLLQNGISMIVLSVLVLSNKPKFTRLRSTFRKLNEENRRYGLQVYYGSLANVSVQYVAGITLGLFSVDNTSVGFYTLALTVSMPMTMLPQVIGTTYFKQFATSSSIAPSLLRTTLLLSTISFILFILLIHPVVKILYPSTYSSVSYYASFLGFACVLQGIGDVFNRFLGAHGQGIYLRNGAFLSGGVALFGYLAGVYFWGISGAIFTRIVSSLVYCFCMILYYRTYIHKNIR